MSLDSGRGRPAGPLLIVGAAGQVGTELMGLAAARGISTIGLARSDLDICDPDAVDAAIARWSPRLIVNAAAYTAVDKAESEPDLARTVNAAGPGNLARGAEAAAIPLVHISTDYVFDGTKSAPYSEDDPIAPLGVYGQTKAEGEARVREANGRHVILRTSWVYGRHGANFLKTMLRLARDRDRLRVVADQHGCPTATLDIAEAILAVDAAIAAGAQPWGTYHFAGTGATNWCDFAREIMARLAEIEGRAVEVEAIGTADYPTPARRPANSRLESARFAAAFGYRAQPWQARVAETVRHLVA